MSRNTKKIITVIAVTLLSALILGTAVWLTVRIGNDDFQKQETVNETAETAEDENTTDKEMEEWKELYSESKAINSDFVGYIRFESGLIDVPFVQGETNDTYLRTDWQTNDYDAEGSVFMDYRNTTDDQNIIIYGHYVYRSYEESGTHKFTPLALLLKEENYAENSRVKLYLETEIREYEIVSVYYCPLNHDLETDESLQYFHTNYEKDYFKKYKKAIEETQEYDTGVKYGYSDSFLTLQTCVENHEYLRQIVLCKLINTTYVE